MMFFSENSLSISSRMKSMPTSTWITLKVGWKLLKDIRKHKKLSLLKLEKPPSFLTLKQSLPLLLPLH
jgi:hypothetical protein